MIGVPGLCWCTTKKRAAARRATRGKASIELTADGHACKPCLAHEDHQRAQASPPAALPPPSATGTRQPAAAAAAAAAGRHAGPPERGDESTQQPGTAAHGGSSAALGQQDAGTTSAPAARKRKSAPGTGRGIKYTNMDKSALLGVVKALAADNKALGRALETHAQQKLKTDALVELLSKVATGADQQRRSYEDRLQTLGRLVEAQDKMDAAGEPDVLGMIAASVADGTVPFDSVQFHSWKVSASNLRASTTDRFRFSKELLAYYSQALKCHGARAVLDFLRGPRGKTQGKAKGRKLTDVNTDRINDAAIPSRQTIAKRDKDYVPSVTGIDQAILQAIVNYMETALGQDLGQVPPGAAHPDISEEGCTAVTVLLASMHHQDRCFCPEPDVPIAGAVTGGESPWQAAVRLGKLYGCDFEGDRFRCPQAVRHDAEATFLVVVTDRTFEPPADCAKDPLQPDKMSTAFRLLEDACRLFDLSNTSVLGIDAEIVMEPEGRVGFDGTKLTAWAGVEWSQSAAGDQQLSYFNDVPLVDNPLCKGAGPEPTRLQHEGLVAPLRAYVCDTKKAPQRPDLEAVVTFLRDEKARLTADKVAAQAKANTLHEKFLGRAKALAQSRGQIEFGLQAKQGADLEKANDIAAACERIESDAGQLDKVVSDILERDKLYGVGTPQVWNGNDARPAIVSTPERLRMARWCACPRLPSPFPSRHAPLLFIRR